MTTSSARVLEEGRLSPVLQREEVDYEKQQFSEVGLNDTPDHARHFSTPTNQKPVLSGFNTDGLPTLDQVLTRKTLPPVCLYNYYIVLRDRLHAEEQLDFYLDVRHHENLWRRFLKDARKSGIITEEDIQLGGHHLFNRLSHASLSTTNQRPSSRLSDFPLASDRPSSPSTGRNSPLPGASLTSNPSNRYPTSDTEEISTDPRDRDDPEGLQAALGPRNSMVDPSQAGRSAKPRPTRAEIKASAERIYHKYIMPSAIKELRQLPDPVRRRIKQAIENEGRDNPEVFLEAKKLVFDAMEVEAFPRFLRAKVWSNTTIPEALIRLVIGLIFLFLGFSMVLSFVFLDWGPDWQKWTVRIWAMLPIWVGVLNLLIYQTELDPIWVLIFGVRLPFHLAPDRQHLDLRHRHPHILRRTGAQALSVVGGRHGGWVRLVDYKTCGGSFDSPPEVSDFLEMPGLNWDSPMDCDVCVGESYSALFDFRPPS
ncbi:hypothetical protein BC938DRAFT_476109 [Jimgerdemannia flammicorona]|uniref:RGS domain-containing protein n=1 Tax=Jimgerdemannia flammicorona TaxID=994334 RepID=A0A433QQW3_9FUNG|nr:hypothetical protein BC938DRAFT_476109 [Jimgerdemannia flammicorona]